MQQGAAPAQVGGLRQALEGLRYKPDPSEPDAPDRFCDHAAEPCSRCEAARAALAAPTPEYVAGWLACRKEAAERVRRYWGADDAIRALAPPSAPPGPEGASNDRLLLLKALFEGRAEMRDGWCRKRGSDVWYAPDDPQLRAALTEANHG